MAKTIVVLPPCVAAYAHVYTPDDKFATDPDDAKYSIRAVFEEGDDLSKFEAACAEVAEAEWPKVKMDKVNTPIRTADDIENETEAEKFVGKKFITTRTKYMPKIIDAAKDPLPEGVRVMSGDLVRVSVEVYAMVASGKKSVFTRFRAVQLLEKRNMAGDYTNDFDDDDFDGEYEGFGGAGDNTSTDSSDDGDF